VSVAAIRQGLATNLAVIPETQISAYIIMPTQPTIWVATVDIQYDLAMGSRRAGKKYTDEYTATIQAMTDFGDPLAAGQQIDQYLAGSGSLSVKDAIESDPTLAGAADTLHVTAATGPSLSTFQTLSLLLAEWTVTIFATEVSL
jgi:hypothetical protein